MNEDDVILEGVPQWLVRRGVSAVDSLIASGAVTALLPASVGTNPGNFAEVGIRVRVVEIYTGSRVWVSVVLDPISGDRVDVAASVLTDWQFGTVGGES
ncbi:MAG: hypothetical protein ACO3RW_07340 [Burkholderiaceae bacterium]